EVLTLSGYAEEEKLQIAQRYLLPRQWKQAGLTPEQLRLEESALRRIISRYTREAGVRELERSLGRVARKAARLFAEGRTEPVVVTEKDLPELLGPERVRPEKSRTALPPGVSTGLAWTEAGGDVLFVEATRLQDTRGLKLTGQLGKVMKESARAALSFVWPHAEALGIDPEAFRHSGVHIHVPAGAVPKDGPSAGVALVTALASLFTETPVSPGVAMTGEITLSGLVLPVGGIKEKVLAARRMRTPRLVPPRDNEPDLRDLPPGVREEMEIVLAGTIEEALQVTLPPVGDRLRPVGVGG